jgi:hypothetical protein
MATFSKKVMGKEVGDAKVYAKPHDMKGKVVDHKEPSTTKRDPNTLSSSEITPKTGSSRVSAGNPNRDDVKTTGIKIRGTGAATKGVMARGPMA